MNFKRTFGIHFGGTIKKISGKSGLDVMNKMKFGDSSTNQSTQTEHRARQSLLSLFEINIIRYALFIENIKPEDIDPFFLIDFMSLPESYYSTDASLKYG